MSSVGYCFKICGTVDKNITNQRRTSISDSVAANIPMPANTGTLIFGRRFSLNNLTLPTISSAVSKQDDLSSDKN